MELFPVFFFFFSFQPAFFKATTATKDSSFPCVVFLHLKNNTLYIQHTRRLKFEINSYLSFSFHSTDIITQR